MPAKPDSAVSHPVQSVMSRTGSFPLSVAFELIGKQRQKPRLVFDPFAGKGTVLLAARMHGCEAYGMDIAPEAVACSRAKLADITLEQVNCYIDGLRLPNGTGGVAPPEVRCFYHPETLRQILGYRRQIFVDIQSQHTTIREAAGFTLAAVLGILHGHASYSLSIPSAHAYSMSPGYVKRYAAKHGLKPENKDVKFCIKSKVKRCLALPLPNPVRSEVRLGSASQATTEFPQLAGSVDMILTSPPYLNAQTYAKDNWLRLWFLGYNYRQLKPLYIETASIPRYGLAMTAVLQQFAAMLRPGGTLICIAGDVAIHKTGRSSSRRSMFRTGEFLRDLCQKLCLGLQVANQEVHKVPGQSRYFNALNDSNGHRKHDLIERVFTATKV